MFQNRLLKWGLIGLFVVIAIGFAGYLFWTSQPIVEKRIIDKADFPVYLPNKLPEGLTLQRDQTQASKDMLSFVLYSSKTDQDIAVTVQPRPEGFNMQQMIGSGSVKSRAISVGIFYDLSANGSNKYLVDTGESLIFITTSEVIDEATIGRLADSLSRAN